MLTIMNRRRFLGLAAGAVALTPALAWPRRLMAVAGARTGMVYDPRFLDHWIQPGHPESPDRLRAIHAAFSAADIFEQTAAVPISADPDAWIRTIHSAAHIKAIQTRHPRAHAVTRWVVAGALEAVDQVCRGTLRNAFCASRPPGHHATNTGREEGFCFYNTIAIAARYAQQACGLERLLIVDWDYHHGNGTEAAFYTDPSVLFFSTHDRYAYPGTGDPARTGTGAGAGFNINVHLPCGTTDAMIIDAFRQQLLPAVEAFRPDLILVSAGFDSRKDDLLGCYEMTDAGFVALTRMLMQLADRHCHGRLVSILEGGYALRGLASAAVAHVQTLLES